MRGLLGRLGARGEPMPLVQAVAILLGAAARVHEAHRKSTRAITAPETVLVRFDGVVVLGGVRIVGGDCAPDIAALTQLLGDLLQGNRVPEELAQVAAGTYASAAEFSRELASAAKACDLEPSRAALGVWAKRQVYPPRLAHTLRRDDVLELGVDLGRQKPKRAPDPELANGSGKFDLDEVEMDVELDVDLGDLVEEGSDVWTGVATLDDKVAVAAPRAGARPVFAVLLVLALIGAAAAYVSTRAAPCDAARVVPLIARHPGSVNRDLALRRAGGAPRRSLRSRSPRAAVPRFARHPGSVNRDLALRRAGGAPRRSLRSRSPRAAVPRFARHGLGQS